LPSDLAGEADRQTFATLCVVTAELRAVTATISEMNATSHTPGLVPGRHADSLVLNPLYRVRSGLLAQCNKLSIEFGLTPRSRAQLVAGGTLSLRPSDTAEDEARASAQKAKQKRHYTDLAAKYKPRLVVTD
jgi:P27 family predicted phage terminase small subunit